MALTAMALTACATTPRLSEGPPEDRAHRIALSPAASVPASTPYIALVDYPDAALAEADLRRLATWVDGMDDALAGLVDLGLSPEAVFASPLAEALFAGFSGQLTAPGLARLGLRPTSPFVIYGTGLWPTLRVATTTPGRLVTRLSAVARSAGMTVTSREALDGLQGSWSVLRMGEESPPNGEQGDNDWVVLLGQQGAQAVAVLCALDAVPQVLKALSSTSDLSPADSAAARLATIASDDARFTFGVGYIDSGALLGRLLRPEALDSSLVAALELPLRRSPVCDTELDHLSRALPTVAFGWQMTQQFVANWMTVDPKDADFSKALAALVASDGGLGHEPWADPGVSVSMAMDMVALGDLVKLAADRLRRSRLQCPPLKGLSVLMDREALRWVVSARLFVSGLKGIHLRANVDFEEPVNSLELIGAVVHDTPLRLLRLIQPFVGEVALPISDDGVASQLLGPLIPPGPVEAAVQGQLIVVSAGEGADVVRDAVLDGGIGGAMPLLELRVNDDIGQALDRAGRQELWDENGSTGALGLDAIADAPVWGPRARIRGPVATVNGVPVAAAPYYDATSDSALSVFDGAAAMEAVERDTLQALIDQKLIEHFLSDQGLSDDPATPPEADEAPPEADAATDTNKNANKNAQKIRAWLISSGGARVSEAAIADFYQENRVSYAVAEAVKVQTLWLAPSGDDAIDHRLLRRALGKARRGAPMEAVAQAFGLSLWSTAEFIEGEALPSAEVEAAVFKLRRRGQLTGVLRSDQGWHIYRLVARRRARVKALGEVRGAIIDELQELTLRAAETALLARLRSQGEIVSRLLEIGQERGRWIDALRARHDAIVTLNNHLMRPTGAASWRVSVTNGRLESLWRQRFVGSDDALGPAAASP